MFGRDLAGHRARFSQLGDEWGYQSLIWVCVKEQGRKEPVFYSHCGRVHRFHHSSHAGGDVLGAGEWIVEKGRLLRISANSGHYRPPVDYFRRAVLFILKTAVERPSFEPVP